uniref:RT_RNaseH domain-containing protein n=1 Tax=Strongyloides venezuelensis TaxID=75913 RepID=A0A0K0FQ31_STRVS
MEVDAFQLCIGAVLLQEFNNPENEKVLFRKKYVPICYHSKMLSSTKKARVARYLELYGIKKALIFFASLITQKELAVYSDHKPLKKVLKHNVTRKLADFIDAISSYSIKIHYINEKSNSLLDVKPNTVVTETQSTNIVITALHAIQNQLDCLINTNRVNNFKIYKQGKPETAVGILQSVNKNNDTVMIKSKENSMIKRSVLKIRPLENFEEGRSKNE